jgi:hypothetical protein
MVMLVWDWGHGRMFSKFKLMRSLYSTIKIRTHPVLPQILKVYNVGDGNSGFSIVTHLCWLIESTVIRCSGPQLLSRNDSCICKCTAPNRLDNQM